MLSTLILRSQSMLRSVCLTTRVVPVFTSDTFETLQSPMLLRGSNDSKGMKVISPLAGIRLVCQLKITLLKQVWPRKSQLSRRLKSITNSTVQWAGPWTGQKKLIPLSQNITAGHSGVFQNYLKTDWHISKKAHSGGVISAKLCWLMNR